MCVPSARNTHEYNAYMYHFVKRVFLSRYRTDKAAEYLTESYNLQVYNLQGHLVASDI